MPNRKKKKFIDKKNAVTFHLVHRSQHDPLIADEEASRGVLVEATDGEKSSVRREEQQKFGVYFDDDYNYLQHLRNVQELSQVEPVEVYRVVKDKPKKKTEIMLPSSVFGSNVETKEGLLNKGIEISGPQPSWDPDIVAALDDDFNFDDPENQLDDDFISKAMAEGGLKEGDENDKEYGSDEEGSFASDEADVMGSDNDEFFDQFSKDAFGDEETRSQFTSYSMTSANVPRSEALTFVDDKFEKMYEEYDDGEIGALDEDEIEGAVDNSKELLNSVLEQYEREKSEAQITLKDFTGPVEGDVYLEDDEDGDTPDLVRMDVEEKPNKPEFDCESILSTYSTLYNHPTVIEEPKKKNAIKLTKRLGIPDDVLPERGPTLKQKEDNRVFIERVPTYRPKDETQEEKKMRKQAIKDERRMRREEKKNLKEAFKEEEKKQKREQIHIQKSLQATHIQ